MFIRMDFSTALEMLKDGRCIAREGWNGKGMFLFIVDVWHAPARVAQAVGCETVPFIAMKTADGKVVPWLASQTDLLAEDWVELEAAKAEAAKRPLMEWKGGNCPVAYADLVDVETRGGTTMTAPAGRLNWTHDPKRPSNSEIVKWRLA